MNKKILFGALLLCISTTAITYTILKQKSITTTSTLPKQELELENAETINFLPHPTGKGAFHLDGGFQDLFDLEQELYCTYSQEAFGEMQGEYFLQSEENNLNIFKYKQQNNDYWLDVKLLVYKSRIYAWGNQFQNGDGSVEDFVFSKSNNLDVNLIYSFDCIPKEIDKTLLTPPDTVNFIEKI